MHHYATTHTRHILRAPVYRDDPGDAHSKDIELAIIQLGSTSSFDMETEAGQIVHGNGAKQLDQV